MGPRTQLFPRIDTASSDVIERWLYTTTSNDSFADPLFQGTQKMKEECRPETFHYVLCPEKKPSIISSRSPDWKRSMCKYHADYQPRPILADVTKGMYNIYKERCEGSTIAPSPGLIGFSGSSSHSHHYRDYNTLQRERAAPVSCKPKREPKQNRWLNSLQSQSQENFHSHSPERMKASRPRSFTPYDSLRVSRSVPFFASSSYREDFAPEQYVPSFAEYHATRVRTPPAPPPDWLKPDINC